MIKKTYLNHRETIVNFAWRAAQIFGKQGITFIIFLLCAKYLDTYSFGVYNYLLEIIFFLIIIVDFGLSSATSKYVAEYNLTDKEKMKSILFNISLLIFALALILDIIILFVGKNFLKDNYSSLQLLLPLTFFIPITSLYDGVYRGLKKFKQLALMSLGIGFLSIFFVYYLIINYQLTGALIAQNLFYFLLFVALYAGYREIKIKFDLSLIKKIAYYAFIIGLADLGYYLYLSIDVVILGQYGHIKEIGLYETFNKFFIIFTMPYIILGQTLAPQISDLFYTKKYPTLLSKYRQTIIFSFFSSIILSVIFFFFIRFSANNLIKDIDGQLFLLLSIGYCALIPFKAVGVAINQGYITILEKAAYITIPLIICGMTNLIIDLVVVRFDFHWVMYSTLLINIFNIVLTNYLFWQFANKKLKQ